MQNQLKEGLITRTVATQINTELRVKPSKPEDLDDSTVGAALEFLNTDLVEKTLREKTILEKRSKKGEEASAHLNNLKNDEKTEVREKLRKQAKRNYSLSITLSYSVLPLAAGLIAYLSKSIPDSSLALISGSVTLLGFLLQIISLKKIKQVIKRLVIKRYKIKLTSEFKKVTRKFTSGT